MTTVAERPHEGAIGVIVTGALGFLGAAVVEAFRAAGHLVVGIDAAPAPTDGCIGSVDLTDSAAAEAAFDEAWRRLGRVDALANVAGGFVLDRLGGDPATWDRMFAVNLRTCLNMCRIGSVAIRDGGAIVNVGAAAAELAGPGMGPYAASKSAVARLTESLAAELEGRVRVNAVLPRILDTARNRADMPDADWSQWTQAAAVADAIVFLAGAQSRGINGALIHVTAPTRV